VRISVVIAAHNADLYLAEAITSVLTQSRPPDEVVVVADRPTPRALEIMNGFGDRIISSRRDKPGAAGALNQGISLARGDFLAFQDADDLWLPDKLERQTAVLLSDPELEAVFGHVRQFVSPDVPDEQKAALSPSNEILAGISKITMLIRRTPFDRIGAFDESKLAIDFFDWYARAQSCGLKSTMLPEVVALRRLHQANNGRINPGRRDAENLASLKSLMDARRSRGRGGG
jgi:glycosyltransferase involved in cell wall biosynthesis